MANPTITLNAKGWTGSEIINYGYINHKNEKITIKTNARVRKGSNKYEFKIKEADPPKAAWLELTKDGFTSYGGQLFVIMEGLKYNGKDMWDPDQDDWPGNKTWNTGNFALGTSNNTTVNAGGFKWKGVYRMGFDQTKIATPPPPPPPPSNPLGTPPGSNPPPGTPPGSNPPPGTPPGSPPDSSPIWNPGSPGFFSASNIGMWTYIGVFVAVMVLIFVLMM